MNPFTVVYTKEKWGVALRSLFKLQKTLVHTHSYKYRGALFLSHPFLHDSLSTRKSEPVSIILLEIPS